MCIAIVKTKDGKITDEQLTNCFESNPDGAGIAYSHDGKVYVVKGIFDCDKFLEEYHKAEELADGAMLVHCRISTSGHVDVTNCHPHIVNDECVMIHNGILDIVVPKDSEVSDTVIFVRDLLAPLPQDFMSNEAIMGLITEAIGSTNKFAFLNYKGEYAIANEKAGHWLNGVWFSNYSYVSYKSFGKKSSYRNFGYCGHNYCGYGYDEDYYDDFEDFNEFVAPTAEETYMIDVAIDELSDEELLLLGDNPLWACNQMWLTSDTSENRYEYAPVKAIKEFNEDLYEKYSARYWGMIARLYEYELTEDSFTETELQDIVCAYTTGRMNEADFSNMIEGTALRLSENFVIDVDTRYWEAVDENPELEYTGIDDVIDVENIAEEELDDEDEYMDSDSFKLTTEEEHQLELVVANLTDEEVLKLGEFPTYSFYSQSLIRKNPVRDSVSRTFLDNVSPSIATELETRYYEILDNVCYNNKDIETTDVSLKTLINEARKEVANGNSEYASELLAELMDDKYKDFEVNVRTTYDELVKEYPEISFENIAEEELDYEDEEEPVAEKKNIIPVMNMLNRKEKVLK